MSAGGEVGDIFGDGKGPTTALLRSPTVIIAAVGLWGMNVYLFRLFGIDYAHVLTLDLVKEKESNSRKQGDGDEGSGGDESGKSSSNDGGGLLEKRHSHSHSSSAPSPGASKKHHHHPTNHANEVTAPKLIIFSLSLLILLHISNTLWIDVIGGSTIGAIFAFYSSVVIGIAIPLPFTSWIRTALATVFHRTFELVHPRCFCLQSSGILPRAIPFIDVFFADAMCSLSKVFFDWGMLWHLAWHYPQSVPVELHSIAIPSIAASLPYLIRARQCIVMHTIGRMKSDPKRYQHMLNAIKYSTSLWPLLVSAYQKVVSTEEEKMQLEKALIVLFAINSTYSLAWDIIMDWGMMQNPGAMMPESCLGGVGGDGGLNKPSSQSCAHSVLRSRLRFGASTSMGILFVDIVLRYSWLLRFWEKDLFSSPDTYILCTQFLEAIRRALWNLLRVEWENIKQTRGKETEDDVEMVEPFLPVSAMSMSPRAPGPGRFMQES